MGVFEFGVIEAEDQLDDPALDEDADVLEYLADGGASCGDVVDRRTGPRDPTHGQDRPE